MQRFKIVLSTQLLLFSVCLCDLNIEIKDKLLNGFINYYNGVPNAYVCEEGVLQSAQPIDTNTYRIDVGIKVTGREDASQVKFLKCTATMLDLLDNGATVKDQQYTCQLQPNLVNVESEEVATERPLTETPTTEKTHFPVTLDNEVQTNIGALSSGEQFIAIPREQPKVYCLGCSSPVNPEAKGVTELADIGIRQLNLLEPGVQHTLQSVVYVERQVQANKPEVRYTVTLLVNYKNCIDIENESCEFIKACKITILDKPGKTLPDGSKYRAVLANNCTKDWLFGDEGVIVPQNPSSNKENNEIDPINGSPTTESSEDVIRVEYKPDLQSHPTQERVLTQDELKELEEQIVLDTDFPQTTTQTANLVQIASDDVKERAVMQKSLSANPVAYTERSNNGFLSEDKKKAIDDLLSYFGQFSFNSENQASRLKRSHQQELKVMSVAKNFLKLKKNIDKAKEIYKLAEILIEYINEMDLVVKTRVLKEVLASDEEYENFKHFYYIQVLVDIPCEKALCEDNDTVTKLCNGVIDASNDKPVRILSAFCHDKQKVNEIKVISVNDPVISNFANEAVDKINSLSSEKNLLVLSKIIDANTQKVAGILTKLSIILRYANCSVNIPKYLRNDCDIMDELGSKICEVNIYKKHWNDEGSISYSCTDRPIDMNFEDDYTGNLNKGPTDSKIKEMVQGALEYLERKSNKINKLKVTSVSSVSTRIVAGFLTEIDFIVGYTDCRHDNMAASVSECKLLNNEPLRKCKAEIWDRSWLENGRSLNVTCKDLSRFTNIIYNDSVKSRNKRSLGRTGGLGEPAQKNVNDPRYKELAVESLQKFVTSSGNRQHFKVVEIKEVTKQIVVGSVTKISFHISPTNCLIDNSGQPSSSNCEVQDTNNIIVCNSEIWERPWQNLKDITVTCDVAKQRHKRLSVSELDEPDVNDPKYITMAEDSLKQYLLNTNNLSPHKLVRINKVTEQFGDVLVTRLDFSASEKETEYLLNCYSKVYEKEDKQNIIVDCRFENELNAPKKSIRGQEEMQDPSEPIYENLAKESMKKFLNVTEIVDPHQLVSVDRATVLEVSGLMTRLDFIIMNTLTKVFYKCSSTVIEPPGIDEKNIDVNCYIKKKSSRQKHSLALSPAEMFENYINNEERDKRQTDDEYVDEDANDYYAGRVISHLNARSSSRNLNKLVAVLASRITEEKGTPLIKMYLEVAPTFCLRNRDEHNQDCEEMDGMDHKLCYASVYPSASDDYVVKHVTVVCDDDKDFASVTGLSIPLMIKATLRELEKSSLRKFRLVHQGEPQILPTLDPNEPTKMNLIIATTNCSKDINVYKNRRKCFIDTSVPSKSCGSLIWMTKSQQEGSKEQTIKSVVVKCGPPNDTRRKRSVQMVNVNATAEDLKIQRFVKESLEKLEMASVNIYKQKVLRINSHSTKINTNKVTTIDFEVGYTSCLKYEWVDKDMRCDILEHLPRRMCVSHVYERLWAEDGRYIEVNCKDDEAPLGVNVEFESDEMATQLAEEALKHLEAKFPHPRKQKVVRIFSLEKQTIAGLHYRMKIEVGVTNCTALSAQTDCKLDSSIGANKFCKVNVWVRPWNDHPPNFRINCDYQEGIPRDLYYAVQAEHLFREFLKTNKPDYIHDRVKVLGRFQIFKSNVEKIHRLNTHEKGTARYGVTRFADLTYEEFSEKYLGLKPSLRDLNQVPMRMAEIPRAAVPPQYDWRDYGAVTEVKNQGSCGSCWAFSVTGNIEGQWKLRSGKLLSLSEQELVDCDKLDNGCAGGLPDNAYRAIEELGGLETEDDYPYEAENDKCVLNKTLARVQISGAVNISTNESDMAQWLVKHGPISIGINANAMQFYMGGVSHPWKMLCNPNNLDHGVLIVGYGVKDYPLFHKTLPYWTIKNSWGESWGEQGYYRVYRGDGTCGVNQMASSAVV